MENATLSNCASSTDILTNRGSSTACLSNGACSTGPVERQPSDLLASRALAVR